MRISRGLFFALFGVAMTIFSWFSPWSWPAWPALGTMTVVFGTHTRFADLPFAIRGAFVVLLIGINVGAWSAAALLGWWLAGYFRTARRRPPAPP